MIKRIIKDIFVCDMCGHEYACLANKSFIIPKDVFEFTVNSKDGAKNVQICVACQEKLKIALEDKLNAIYSSIECCGERRKGND